MSIEPGGHLGGYRIEAQLGRGGMGCVYRAFDTTLQRPVAIKVLSEADEQARAKLLAEARAASALNHPNVATVHEVGEADGQPYIVMELVEGKPLSELIPPDGLPPETVIRYGLQIADALAHAHEKGIVHRDLKSQNVVITPEGRAKVLDFGLATRLEQQDAEAVTVSMDTQAASATIAGTLTYMAPEVLRGEEATARSDIWALGVLLYEMAAGQQPFGGATRTDVVSAIVKETPGSLPAKVSPGLRNIIQHCLTKEPERRYRHASAIQSALEAIQSDSAATPAVAAVKPVSRPLRLAGGAVVLIIVAVGLGYVVRPGDEVASTVPRLTNPVQVTRAVGLEDFPSLSPDGDWLVYEGNQAGNWDVWVAQVGGGEPVNRTADHRGWDRFPTWSPDGRQIAFLSDRDEPGIYVMPTLAGTPRKIAPALSFDYGGYDAAGLTPQWSRDGAQLAHFTGDSQGSRVLEILSLNDGAKHHIPGTVAGEIRGGGDLSWAPNGRYLAIATGSHTPGVTAISIVSVLDGALIQVTDGLTRDHSPSWSTDVRTLYFVSDRGGSRDLWQQRIGEDGHPEGLPQPVTTGVGIRHATLSLDGSRLAYSRGTRVANVWRVPILENRVTTWADAEQITFDEAYVEHVEVVDGNELLISSDRSGNPDLWLVSASGGDAQQLTNDPASDWGPRLSPDGEEIAFWSNRSGNREVWVMPSSGGQARQLTDAEGRDWYPTWSGDGRQIAFNSGRSGERSVWVMSIGGGDERLVATGSFADWSPDGQWIAFRRGDALWRVRPNGEDAEALTTVPTGAPRWSPNSQEVYFPSGGNLWVRSLEDPAEHPVTDLSGRIGSLGSGRDTDGRYLYFTWREDVGDIWVMDVVQDEP